MLMNQYILENKWVEAHDSAIRENVLQELYNEILVIEDVTRELLNATSMETDLNQWLDLNGKLSATTSIKHMIYDKSNRKEHDMFDPRLTKRECYMQGNKDGEREILACVWDYYLTHTPEETMRYIEDKMVEADGR